jgi:two-component system sensor histidine kinase CiaH
LIKKLRREFILVIMSVVAVLILAAFIAVLVSISGDLERESRFTLNSALKERSDPAPHGNDPGGSPGGRPMPIITVTTDSTGAVTEFSNQIFSFSDNDVPDATRQALVSGKTSGTLRDYKLRFLVRASDDGSARLAFIDTSMESRVLSNLLLNSAIIGLSTLLLFFAVSVLLSRWVVLPVEKAWNSQRRFIADASHELKTPLTVILSNSAMLSGESALADGKMKARLGNILEEAKRMKALVDDLLLLARSDDARSKPVYEKTDLSALLQSAVLRFEPVIFELGKKFDYIIAEGITIKGNAARLNQLIEILLDNACKYSAPGGLITAGLRASAKGEACLDIANEGEPIPKDELPRLFERFYRLDKSRSSPGYGLGLSIASAVVRELGGRIWASSDSGRVVFSVALPMAK